MKINEQPAAKTFSDRVDNCGIDSVATAEDLAGGGGDLGGVGVVTEPGSSQIPEPENQIPEPSPNSSNEKTSEIPEPKSPNLDEIPEPVRGNGGFQIPEPDENQIPEPGETIDVSVTLSRDRRLWNLETYKDRHGKQRAKQVLRFVGKPIVADEIGIVTEALAEELKARRGRGRWAASRAEADELRTVAEQMAIAHRRHKGLRGGRKNVGKRQRSHGHPGRDAAVPETQSDLRGADVSDLLTYRQKKIAKAS